MPAYNYGRTKATAHRLIDKYGRAGVLRRVVNGSNVDRAITVVLLNYSTRERDGDLIQFADQRAYISAVGMATPPDFDEEILVVGAGRAFSAPFEIWRLVAPPMKLDPAGTVVYYEQQVRK